VKTHHNDQWNLNDEKLGFNNTKECQINNNKTEKNFSYLTVPTNGKKAGAT